MRTFFLTLFVALLLSGCKVEEVEDGTTINQDAVPAANCIGLSENTYGCYGADSVFNGKIIVDGLWSLYTQSNVENVGNETFYDRYKRGYTFRDDGSVFMREQTEDFIYFREWGIDDDGVELTLSDGVTYTYQAVFANDSNCFLVTQEDGTDAKLCSESFVDFDGENGSGYFGANVTFGNLTHYFLNAVGTWTIAPYDSGNTGTTLTVTLQADGTTTDGSEWGVSEDGKVMTIDGISYLAYQFLNDSDSDCIATFELSGGVITSTTWKLCVQ